MTCVVALADERRVVVAADSAGASFNPPEEIYTLQVPKVFRSGPWVIGYAASWRFGQILQHHVEWPAPPPDTDLISFFVVERIGRLREVLKQQGFLRTDADGRQRGGQVVIGYQNQIVLINERFEVARLEEPYAAIGSGRLVAYGALHALADLPGLGLEQRAERALAAACCYVPGIRGPFVLEATAPELRE